MLDRDRCGSWEEYVFRCMWTIDPRIGIFAVSSYAIWKPYILGEISTVIELYYTTFFPLQALPSSDFFVYAIIDPLRHLNALLWRLILWVILGFPW